MSNLRKAAAQLVKAVDGASDVGFITAFAALKEEVETERQEGRRRTAEWRKAHPKAQTQHDKENSGDTSL